MRDTKQSDDNVNKIKPITFPFRYLPQTSQSINVSLMTIYYTRIKIA